MSRLASALARALVTASALAALLGAAPAAADECAADVAVWIGGSFAFLHDPENWSTGVVPGPDTTIVFEDPGPSVVLLGGDDLAVGRMILRGGPVTLEADGALLSVSTGDGDAPVDCPAVLVGGPSPAALDLEFNFPDSRSFEAESLVLGTADGIGWLLGFVLFTEAAIEDRLVVGGADLGLVDRLERLTAGSLVVGQGADGRVELVRSLEVAGPVVVGDAAGGEIVRSRLDLGELIIGAQGSGSGQVIVDTVLGDEADLNLVAGDVEVGSRGFGLLEVRRPLAVGGDMLLGVHAEGLPSGWLDRGDGFLVVDSTLEIAGDLRLGLLGHARMDVGPGGRVTVGGDIGFTALDGGVDPDRLVRIGLGAAPEDVTPLIAASGSIVLPETDIRFEDDVVPAQGQSWTIAEAGTSSAGDPTLSIESLSVPLLPPGLAWSAEQTATRLTLTVTSAPGSPDVDGDGVVELADLLLVLEAIGDCPPSAPCPADLDGDGAVTLGDVLLVLLAWN